MTDYNASDTRQIRAAIKATKAQRSQDDGFLLSSMSTLAGRSWMWRLLGRCHAFHSPYTGDDAATNFQCGEQNIGLELVADLLRACPDQFIFMMREANDVEHRHDDSRDNRQQRDSANIGRDDSGAGIANYPDDGDDSSPDDPVH